MKEARVIFVGHGNGPIIYFWKLKFGTTLQMRQRGYKLFVWFFIDYRQQKDKTRQVTRVCELGRWVVNDDDWMV